jgi:hypothetical protein
MKKYSKYGLSLVLFLLVSFFVQPLILSLSKSPSGTNDEIAYIAVGINLILGAVIGCTALIISTIRENNNK